MNILKLISKAASIGLIFVAPLGIVLQRYQSQEITTVNATLGLVPTLFIIVIVLVAVWFTTQQFLEIIRTDKFGFLSITFFGLILGLLLFLSWFVLNNLVTTAQENLDLFVSNFSYHKDTLLYMLYAILAGIFISVTNKILEFKL